MEIELSVFSVEAFHFFEFYENEAKLDKRYFTRDLSITFKVKNF